MRTTNAVTWILCCALPIAPSLLAAGCAEGGAPGGEEPAAEADHELYTLPSKYWAGAPPFVNVCWEPSTFNNPAHAEERQWIEDAMRRNWVRYARVNLVDVPGASSWQACTSGEPGIHAWISSDQCGGSNTGLGVDHDGVSFGLRLPDCEPAGPCPPLPGVSHEQCVRRIALHEFGHALGFYHEEERPGEGLPDCNGHPGTIGGGQKLGAYNAASPMAECDATTTAVDLTPGDIAAVQRAYGRRIRGSLVSPNGRCVASHGSAAGQDAFLWDCDERENDQEWDYTFASGLLFVPGSAGLCLGAPGSSPSQIARLVTCAESLDQQWRFQNTYIRGYGKCVDLHGGITSGGAVQAWDCGALGGVNQRWTVMPGSTPEIRFGGPSSTACLTVPPSGAGQLTVTACNGGDRQKFILANADQQIGSVAFPSKCVDLQSVFDADYLAGFGLPENGAAIQLFDCSASQYNQKWNFSGEVLNRHHGRCLERDHGGNGAAVRLGKCDGSEDQLFDYYPL